MVDDSGRSIGYLRLSVTDRCNCRCRYCMGPEGIPALSHKDILSYEEMAEIVAAAATLGVHKVRITGGEPLARLGVEELVGRIKAIDGIDEVCMTTNATLLAPKAQALADAGLDRVNVSLDSLDPGRYHTITRCGQLDDALEGIEAAEAAGLGPIKLNAVLLGGLNDHDIRPLALLAQEKPWSVRFIELMPIGEAVTWPEAAFVPAETVLEKVPELQAVGADGVAETYSAPGWAGTVGLIRPISHRFCEGCNRIRLTADGMVKPCLHSAAEIPMKGLHGGALVEALREAIAHKPARHQMVEDGTSHSVRAMNEIGG